MAFIHGSKTEFHIGGTAGIATRLTPYLDTVTLASKQDSAEASVFGIGSKQFVQGLQDHTVALGGKWDSSTAVTGMDAVMFCLLGNGSAVNFVYSPAGTATGSDKYSGSANATDYSIVGPIGAVVSF